MSFKATVTNNGVVSVMEFKEADSITVDGWKRRLCEQLGVAYKQVELEGEEDD
jgi:hypothetical protein